jgi:hypothetical protein
MKQDFRVIATFDGEKTWDYGIEEINFHSCTRANGKELDREFTLRCFLDLLKERAELMLVIPFKELEFITIRNDYTWRMIKDSYTFIWNPIKLNLGVKEIFLKSIN